ncbi:DUF262 domain-containing protein [Dolichospermum circinale]|uniref:DUF262 domain-containing protein n=1 Tax=Dolichospermum circinale TaxID=109265 RepID=UPI0003F5B54E|nr:DUF262 domain-containing protein [Dolichospermum circinale]MDB9475399.1 DUF262 domain-containing protein [Dolichospermum circinale CS-537/11]MDB9478328.1 DUF262 domain-containing protein [Dolichospermum circinale CS-537/03]MDB9481415.1 DUF262 domain-containing protein [Dolichospermum circinale CS-537/05]
MNDKISVKPDIIFIEELLKDIANGEYKIPIFQREFVWQTSQMLELFDSILKGYPIGSLLFWNTQGYKTKDQIGPYIIRKNNNNNTKYILDGFQRISTLFGALINPKDFPEKNENDVKDFLIYFDIQENNFSKRTRKGNIFSIPLYKVYDNRELFDFVRQLDKENIPEIEKDQYIENLRNLHDILHKYKLPYVEIKGGDIKSAVEIFSRVNSTGTEISEDFMLSALSYNQETGFLLSDSITEFLNSLNKYNFEDLKRDIILNCIASNINNVNGKIYFDVKLEELRYESDLESCTNNAYNYIKQAVEFLYKRLFVINLRLLPYPAQLIFISEYFRLNLNPTSQELQLLENWFWITTYSNYFTIYSLSQQRNAYQVFCDFAEGKHPNGIYQINDDIEFTTAKYPTKLNFTGVRPKALQLFYLKSILGDNEPQDMEGIKEIFISSKRDRTPGNIILRLSSEFDQPTDNKILNNFINSNSDILEKHFITKEMVSLYNQGKIDDGFIDKRNEYLKSKEREFVETMEIIKYIE